MNIFLCIENVPEYLDIKEQITYFKTLALYNKIKLHITNCINVSRNYQHIQYTYRKIQNMLCRLFWFLEIETTITQFIQKQF